MKNATLAAVGLSALVAAAHAGVVVEIEDNNSFGTATFAGTLGVPGGSIIADGTITSGDFDWFRVDIDDQLAFGGAAIFSSTDDSDGQIMLADSNGDIIAFDDDSNIGLQSSIEFGPLAAGTYYFGVSAFPDVGIGEEPTLFDGLDSSGNAHEQNFAYKLIIGANIVPAPGAVALAGFGGLVAARRRR